MKRLILLLLFIPIISHAQLIDDDVMPFGFYTNAPYGATDQTFFSAADLQVINDALGINQMVTGCVYETTAGIFADSGIFLYPVGRDTVNNQWAIRPQQQYSHSTYYVCEPEQYSDYHVCCQNYYGGVGAPPYSAYWVWKGTGNMLANYWLKLDNGHNTVGADRKNYFSYLKIGRDSTTLSDSAYIGSFIVEIVVADDYEEPVDSYVPIFEDSIYACDIPQMSNDTLLQLINELDDAYTEGENWFNVDEDAYKDTSVFIRFRFKTVNVCTLFVDNFRTNCQYAADLMGDEPDTLVAKSIKEFTGNTGFEGNIAGWILKDTPRANNYRSNAFIDSLIQVAMADSGWADTAKVRGHPWFAGSGHYKYLNDFVKITKPKTLWAYLYPIDWYTEYTGTGENGLQADIQTNIVIPCDTIRVVMDRFNTEGWMYGPQFWYTPDDNNDEPRRKPTLSELRCETFIGMCYQPIGIMGWLYNSRKYDIINDDSTPQGIVDSLGNPQDVLYSAVRDYINPYIKAIDSTYLGLTWDNAFAINFENDFDPPNGAWIDTIYAVSNDTTPNPDIGWFHVGQYTEGSDKYVMIVNRACSQGPENPAPAPSITSTIKFDASALGWNYVYVIDIADSVDYISYDSVLFWPETTYTAKMPDGTIPFTTVLGPGEGRLFKIVGTSQLNLIDTINTNYTYQGKIKIIGDATVPEDSTMNIRGPARFEILRCPTDSTGQDPALVEININGILSAIGTSSDSIIFYPDTAFECTPILGADPEPGDWYGIYFDQNAVGALDYCSIQYATYGVEMRQNSEVAIIDCNVGNNSTAGIYNFGGYLDLINSAISYNDIYGLYGYRAADSVYNTKFIDNETYGIKIEGTNLTNDSTFLLYDTLNYVPSPSQYGILVDKNDYIRIEQCKINGYDQGAIRLTNSDALINNCDFTSTVDFSTLHGINTENSSFPVVRGCVFDFVKIGVKAFLPSIPDLGDTTVSDGENSFLNCSKYFVHFSGPQINFGVDTLYAEMNWWGDAGGPSSSKLYVGDRRTMVIEWDPPLSSAPAKLNVGDPLPLEFSLNQNYPNPFNPITTISFSLDKPQKTIVTIYNILGQKVATPVNEILGAGSHGIIWDGKSSSGSSVASGIYFYTIQSGDHFDSKKMLLLR